MKMSPVATSEILSSLPTCQKIYWSCERRCGQNCIISACHCSACDGRSHSHRVMLGISAYPSEPGFLERVAN